MRISTISILCAASLSLWTAGCASGTRLFSSDGTRVHHPVPSVSAYPDLKNRMDALFADSLFPPSNAGVLVRSMSTGEDLYALNPRALFTPASNQKLFTAAAALTTLGESFQFRTRLFADTVNGKKIILRGSGDPLLSTRDIDSVAASVAPLLAGGKEWVIAGDVSYFDDLSFGTGWMWDDETDASGMLLSPLSVNSNIIVVRVSPGNRTGDPLVISLDPPTSYVTIENRGTTSIDSLAPSLSVARRWRERSNVIDIQGAMRLGTPPRNEEVTLWQPEYFALTLLKESLARRGVLAGSIVLDTVLASSRELFCLARPLDSVLVFMDKTSDNLSAENLLKTIGAENGGKPGTAAKGIGGIHGMLSCWNIDTNAVVIADGSGVSRYNLTSAEVIVQLLAGMRGEHFATFLGSLPVAGRDGTLKSRMRGTSAEGNLRAKTGTLSGVSSLSGYVTDADGDLLAFSILMQNYPSGAKAYRAVQDSIGVVLSTLSLR